MNEGPESERGWWKLVKEAVSAWSADYAPSMGAALSYYSVFSMGPLLLIVISVAGLVFGQEAVKGEIFGQLRAMMGDQGADGVQALLQGVSKPSHGVLGTVVGVVVLLIGATSVFGELQDALDRIWRAPARDGTSGVWGLIRARFLSFGMILGIAFLLMVSLVLGAAVSALGKWWGSAFGGWALLGQIVNVAVGFAVTTGAFAMIYKIMPRVNVRWHDVWLGAIVTSALFTAGKFLIGLYIGKTGLASGFGAAGSVAVIFVWVYYSAQIFLMGAEFTWVYARTFGSMRGKAVAGAAPEATIPELRFAAPETAVGPLPDLREIPALPASSSLKEASLLAVIGVCVLVVMPKLARRRLAKKMWRAATSPRPPDRSLGRPT